jgi:VanZ family protein
MAPINPVFFRQFALTCLVLLVTAIFIGGEQPGAGSLFPPPWDKVVHITAYGIIAILAGMAYPNRPLALILLLTVCIGGSDEIHQIFIPGRHAGFDDLTADLVGGLIALPGITKLRRSFYPFK